MIKIECKIEYKDIKLNEELFDPSTITMDYYTLYVKNEMAKGISEFHAGVKFLMDENVHQKYKDIYRKKQCRIITTINIRWTIKFLI